MTFIGLDLETIGDENSFALQPFRVLTGQASISSIAVIDTTGHGDFKLKPTPKNIQTILEGVSTEGLVCGWNIVFDLAWLYAYGFGSIIEKWNVYDGYIAYRQLNNVAFHGSGYGLKAAVAREWPELDGYDSGISFENINEDLLEYNKRDSYLTALLCEKMYKQQTTKQNNLVRIVSECSKPVAQAWIKGIQVNKRKLLKIKKLVGSQFDEALKFNNMSEDILRSPKKLREWIEVNTGTVVNSVAKPVLSTLKGDAIQNIREAKRTSTILSRVVNSTLEAIDYVGSNTLHPSPRLFNTYTGRMGYEAKVLKKYPVAFPLHQMPRDLQCRSILEVDKGYKLVEFDFAGQEARLIADYSRDEAMMRAFNEGQDLHAVMGARLASQDFDAFIAAYRNGDPVAKQQRMLGKIANLALQYRMSPGKLIETARVQNNLELSDEEARRIHRTYRDLYPGVVRYWQTAIDKGRINGVAETRGGRRVKLDWTDHKAEFHSEQTAINFPIQGTGADMKYLALIMIHERAFEGVDFLFDLHDGLFFKVKNNLIDKTVPQLKEMFDLPYQLVFKWSPRVSFPVDCKVGQNWGEMYDFR